MQRNVLEYLEKTALRLPDKCAVADEKASYIFSELLSCSRAVGSALLPHTRPRGFVAVLTERRAGCIALFLGALQAGCAYVPIDAKMPAARMEAILRQVQPDVIAYCAKDAKVAGTLTGFAPIVELEAACECPVDEAGLCDRRAQVLDCDCAYVIFTSGSTGAPKGIGVAHRSVIDFADWLGETCATDENEILANQAPFYFDLSMKDLVSCLRCGATMHILPKKYFMFPKLLTAFLNEHRVTTLFWATSAFRMTATSGILERDPPRYIRKVILGGEALQAVHLNRWRAVLPDTRYINLYGPTEVTVDCTCYPIDREFRDDEPIPIGTACANMEVMLLDDALRPVADGEVGEICVRGTGVALGYLGDPEKTANAFVPNPNSPWGERIYRTGDLARRGPDGNLYFLARKDDQIKHMGYRIELGEVEAAVCAIPGVDAAACFFDREKDFIVCACQTELTPDALAACAKTRIPKYMTPNVWRTEQRLPVNANGKIDRVKLKERYFAKN